MLDFECCTSCTATSPSLHDNNSSTTLRLEGSEGLWAKPKSSQLSSSAAPRQPTGLGSTSALPEGSEPCLYTLHTRKQLRARENHEIIEGPWPRKLVLMSACLLDEAVGTCSQVSPFLILILGRVGRKDRHCNGVLPGLWFRVPRFRPPPCLPSLCNACPVRFLCPPFPPPPQPVFPSLLASFSIPSRPSLCNTCLLRASLPSLSPLLPCAA